MFYGANVDAKLFRGSSTANPLPAFLSDSYTEVPLTGSIAPLPRSLNTAFFNVTNDADRRSVGGTKGDKTSEGNIVIDWDEPMHASMYADADVAGGVKRNWYLQYPTGRREYFSGFVSQFNQAAFDAGEDAVEHRADWVITASGATLVVP